MHQVGGDHRSPCGLCYCPGLRRARGHREPGLCRAAHIGSALRQRNSLGLSLIQGLRSSAKGQETIAVPCRLADEGSCQGHRGCWPAPSRCPSHHGRGGVDYSHRRCGSPLRAAWSWVVIIIKITTASTGGLRWIWSSERTGSLDLGRSDHLSLYHAACSSASHRSLPWSSASLLAQLGSHTRATTPRPQVCPPLASPFLRSPSALRASRVVSD